MKWPADGISCRKGSTCIGFVPGEKARRDWNEREEKIASAMDQLRVLADPKRKQAKTEAKLRLQADAILAHFAVQAWVKVDIALEEVVKFRQLTRGRASAHTAYRKVVRWLPLAACGGRCVRHVHLGHGAYPNVQRALDRRRAPQPVVLQVSKADKSVAELLSCVLRLPRQKCCR